MDQLAEKELFKLLKKSSQTVTNLEIKRAYEVFLKEVISLNQIGADYQTVFRSLNLIRIEFQSLQSEILCDQGKKCA